MTKSRKAEVTKSSQPNLVETHLAQNSETGEMHTVRVVTDINGNVKILPPENYQSHKGSLDEHRDAIHIPLSNQSPANIFRQEDSSSDQRLLTLEAQGRVIKRRSGPVSWQDVHDQ